tara:strand:+ start:32 stop:1000 length:969 start_codon:yes stop_codon:yes gene_type:complete
MCADPVTMAIIGGGKAILGNYSAVQAASARNKNRKKLYDLEKIQTQSEHWRNITKYYLRGVDAEYAWADNTIAASRAAEKEQLILNKEIAESLRLNQTDYVKSLQSPLLARSLEKTGVTAGRMRKAVKAAIGRSKAARSAQIDIAYDNSALVFDEIDRIKKKANRDADLMMGLEPSRGPGPAAPVWDKGPSAFQQLANVAIGAAMGYIGAKAGAGKSGNLGSELTDAGRETLMDAGYGFAWDSTMDIGAAEIISPEALAGSGDLFSTLGTGVNPTWLEWSSTLNQSSDLYKDLLRANRNIQYDINPIANYDDLAVSKNRSGV